MKVKLAEITSCTCCPFEGWDGKCTKDKSIKCDIEIPDRCPLPDKPQDEMSVCDICGKQIWFSIGTIYYIDDEVKLLCPKCQANKALHSTRTSPGE